MPNTGWKERDEILEALPTERLPDAYPCETRHTMKNAYVHMDETGRLAICILAENGRYEWLGLAPHLLHFLDADCAPEYGG